LSDPAQPVLVLRQGERQLERPTLISLRHGIARNQFFEEIYMTYVRPCACIINGYNRLSPFLGLGQK